MLTEAERLIAARTVYGEARGEPLEGKVAVAWVIRNRVRADLRGDGRPDWWGDDVISVCHKRWQFSCWNQGDPNLRAIAMIQPHDPQWLECLKVVDLVDSDAVPDPTGGATHYFAPDVVAAPHWATGKKPSARIGRHVFFAEVER